LCNLENVGKHKAKLKGKNPSSELSETKSTTTSGCGIKNTKE